MHKCAVTQTWPLRGAGYSQAVVQLLAKENLSTSGRWSPALAEELLCGCRCLPAVCFPAATPLHPCSCGGCVEGTGRGGRNGRSKACAAPWQGKLVFSEGLVTLKSSAKCSCSQLGSLAASFKILYFCEKSGARNSFISASSDATHMGAAQTCPRLGPLSTLPYPSCLLCLPSLVPVMVISGWWQSCKIPERVCALKPTTTIHPSTWSQAAGWDHHHEITKLQYRAGPTPAHSGCMWLIVTYVCNCKLGLHVPVPEKEFAVVSSWISLFPNWKEVFPWGVFYVYSVSVYLLFLNYKFISLYRS